MMHKREQQGQVITGAPARAAVLATGSAVLSVAAGIGAWIAYSRWVIDHQVPLPPAIEAERRTFTSAEAGTLSYYVDAAARGRPLVLVHSVNACASAYEMRPLFEHYRGTRPVYALDLPGFGFSERADRPYSPELFAAAITALLRDRVRPRDGADVIALSLGAEFAALAALEHPALVRSLVLISPTGFTARAKTQGTQTAQTDESTGRVSSALAQPFWGQVFYDLLVTRPSIRYFLSRSFAGAPDRGLANYDYLSAHQPGARHAPLRFVRGKLFTPAIREDVYQHLAQPVLVLYDQDGFTRFDTLPDTLLRYSNWHATRLPGTHGLPHFEQPDETCQAIETFWREHVGGDAAAEPRGGALGRRTQWLLRRPG